MVAFFPSMAMFGCVRRLSRLAWSHADMDEITGKYVRVGSRKKIELISSRLRFEEAQMVAVVVFVLCSPVVRAMRSRASKINSGPSEYSTQKLNLPNFLLHTPPGVMYTGGAARRGDIS